MTAERTATVVLDASAAVALFTDGGAAGAWAEAAVKGMALCAPDLMPFEVSNILRRHTIAGVLDESAATLAHADLVALPVDLYPYAALADRAWQLRKNLTAYDASYAALAELLGAPLVTLDTRLAKAPGLRCEILGYPGTG